jgi:endoglucanase
MFVPFRMAQTQAHWLQRCNWLAPPNGGRPSSRNALARTLVLAVIITGIHLRASATPAFAGDEAWRYNELLGRGINLGNALEAPREGTWGRHLEGAVLSRDQALSRGLIAVINVHHYDEMNRNPDEHLPRLLAIWRQIGQHYRGYPDRLSFELLNEPSEQLTDKRWQAMVPELLRVVRESNPTRMLIVGPAYWNGLNHLENLRLPENDRRLIATFHYYAPYRFTHQAAGWIPGSDAWKGTAWEGSAPEQEALTRDFDKAAEWAARNKRALYVGEFGAYQEADMASRGRWTKSVAEAARKRSFSWAYWEFCSEFGAYDPLASKWRAPLLESLMGNRNGGTG